MYLYLAVFSNFVSIKLFGDSVCTKYPWTTCSSVLYNSNNDQIRELTGWTTFFGFLVQFSVFLPLFVFISLIVWNGLVTIVFLHNLRIRVPIYWLFIFGSMWMWFFLSLNIGVFFAKDFSAAVYQCDFRNIPTTTPMGYSDVSSTTNQLTHYYGMCAPLKYLGNNRGVQIDDKIDVSGCDICVQKGFWTLFLTGCGLLLIPLFAWLIKYLIKKRKQKKEYESLLN
jgi:hypothetical protein